MAACEIVAMTERDWDGVREIYAQGISTGNATFEESVPSWSEWDSRHLASCRLVARSETELLAFAALSPVSARPAYRGLAEVSIYVLVGARGKGVGTALLEALIVESERAGIWTLQAGILAENSASIRLHQQAGFRVVGTRERIGCMDGRWRDTVLMERRSAVAGV